jgi:hypothetical protein
MAKSMFESLPENRNATGAKVLAISAVGIGIGFGLCGLGAAAANTRVGPYVIGTGATLFFASLAVFSVTLLVMLVQVIIGAFRR